MGLLYNHLAAKVPSDCYHSTCKLRYPPTTHRKTFEVYGYGQNQFLVKMNLG